MILDAEVGRKAGWVTLAVMAGGSSLAVLVMLVAGSDGYFVALRDGGWARPAAVGASVAAVALPMLALLAALWPRAGRAAGEVAFPRSDSLRPTLQEPRLLPRLEPRPVSHRRPHHAGRSSRGESHPRRRRAMAD